MRNAMRTRTIEKVGFILFALAAPLLAQNQQARQPIAPISSPVYDMPAYDVSVGYANLTTLTSGQHVNLNGLDVGGSFDLNSRWAAMVDSMYVRTSDILGTGHAGYQLSFLGGPAFYPFERGNTRFSVHALAGGALVDGAVPINTTDYYHGWLTRFSYAAGGGVEHALSETFGVRVQADYLHSAFFDAQGAVRPQGSLRLTVSLVLRRKMRQESTSE
jgi:opacity protein-like surface antigen